jgi:hypothetical protein
MPVLRRSANFGKWALVGARHLIGRNVSSPRSTSFTGEACRPALRINDMNAKEIKGFPAEIGRER